ncbi:hypothetical protein Rsub_09848 [Raphidocelis subcapitata]|uniref:Uncharacterized protein n=1 Tax=Raphidocelis subcapitata TaxID=307507 RepID=A0A2V0P9I9_9CHLO|nr:hypothetical protein Rsub_09848 [Raphidocelis subcapitata]|eukprot:GBF96506.1 hypothetical protein Rsub_09848 [Raphidocelis subcapitata]
MYMTPAKAGSWERVGSKKQTEERRKQPQEDTAAQARAKAAAKANAIGGWTGNSVFEEFDRTFALQAAAKEKERKQEAAAAAATAGAAGAPLYKGGFAHLSVEEPRPDPAAAAAAAAAAAKPTAAAAKKAAAAKPKPPKKPRVGVASVAASIDVGGVLEAIAGLQQRYANSEASQVEVLADTLGKMFKEAQLDLPKALATKPLAQCVDIPLADLPAPLANALASFCSSVSEAALAEVAVALMAALTEGLPMEAGAPPSGQPAPQRQSAGLLVMLATMLRTRPGALVLASPQLLAMGRTLTAPGRLPLLLWTLSQAAASEPAAAVAAWVRVLLPQALGAPLLGRGGGAAAAAVPRLDAASAEVAVAYLEDLLKAAGASADVALGGGALEPAVPGGAVEALSRAAAGEGEGAGGADAGAGGKGSGKGAGLGAGALSARLHAPLVAMAGRSRADAKQTAEWLLLALESAGLSNAPPETPDALTDRAAAAVAAVLASPSGEAAFGAWENKHKGQLRGSSRVLCTLARRPELLRPVLANRGRSDSLRRLLAALPARHRSALAMGKGWQAAAARASDGAVSTLQRRAAGGWGAAFGGGGGGKGGGKARAGGGGGGLLVGAVGAAAAAAGVLAVVATHRREVCGLLAHYAGRDAAEALDASLAPVDAALAPARAAAAPHVAALLAAAAPHVEAARAAAAPRVEAAAAALAPHLQALQQRAAPLVEQAAEAWARLAAQAQEIYAKAAQS